MNKQTVIVVAAAIVLFAVALGGALALTGGSKSDNGPHMMPNGQTMTAPMHTMSDGETMPGMTMP